MDLRSLAHLACRLLALYFAVEAAAGVPALAKTLLATPAPDWRAPAFLLAHGAIAVRATAALVLWFAAWPIACRLPAARHARGGAPDLTRACVVLCGVLVLAGMSSDVALLAADALSDRIDFAAEDIAARGIAVALRLVAGAILIAASKWIAAKLRGAPGTALARAGRDGAGEAPALFNELVETARSLGLSRAADLALTLKSEADAMARSLRSGLDQVLAAVQTRHPDFGAVTAADGTVTIVFSDMEGFTAMTQRVGDRRAHAVIKIHNRIVREAVRAHGGQEVELQGDGFLLAFPQAAGALRCALEIQRGCASYSRRHPRLPIRVRIGLHTGKPIKEGDRFFGITVILAARIAAQAGGGETLVSETVHGALAADAAFTFGEAREAQLKGLDGTHRMYPASA